MRAKTTLWIVAGLAAVASLAGAACDLVGLGDDQVAALLVGVVGDEPDISLPSSVEVGEEFVVTVKSYGLSGCWRKGETRSSVDGLEASVRPFDHEPSGGQACTANIPEFIHEATLRFQEAGTARVTIQGRALQNRAPVTFLREVTVTGVTAGG